MMHTWLEIMRFEWKRWRHDHTTRYLWIGLLLLSMLTVFAGIEHYREHADSHAMATSLSQQQWDAQPDRHPHRVSHFGDFVFKPLHFLSSFDTGGHAFTGSVLFLESHRQNSANFNEAGESSALIRFGQFSPAYLLQIMVPLILIFMGYSAIAEEREHGTARQLIASGMRPMQWMIGKWLALAIPGILLTMLIGLVAAFFSAWNMDTLNRIGLLVIAYAGYILVWSAIIILVSSLSRHAHGAMLFLITLWLIVCIAGPRLAYTFAQQQYPLATLVEMDFEAERDVKKIGDSHNPNDPHFNAFREAILKQYGVDSIEALPVNYNGLLMTEGERLTTQLYREKHGVVANQMRAQQRLISQLAWLNPTLAIQGLSRALSGSDLAHHLDFLEQAETRRYAVTQYLNTLHTHAVQHQGDKDQRLDASHWQSAPRVEINLPKLPELLPVTWANMARLALWLLLLLAGFRWSANKLDRS